MKLKHAFPLIVIFALLYACSSDSPGSSTPDPNPNPDPNNTTKVTYAADIASIINGNCISCHSDPPVNSAPMALTTYAQVKNYVNVIITRVNSTTNPMPPSPNNPLSASDKSLIQQWKNDGLLEN